MKIARHFLLLLVAFVIFASSAEAQYRRPSVSIKPSVRMKGARLTLKEIATIGAGEKEYAQLVAMLQEVDLGEAPAPQTKMVLLGAKVLEAIEKAQVPLDGFAYSIPKVVTVEREGRTVSKDEVLQSVKSTLWKEKSLDLQVREVQWPVEQVIPIGLTEIHTEQLGSPSAGKLPLRVEVVVDHAPAARFLATALVDDWREVPVPVRHVERGMLVVPGDIQLVRINLLHQPADVVAAYDQMVGRRAKIRLTPGETVRKNALDIPPMIPKGKRVSVLYKRGMLAATMNGTALEDGFDNSTIRIRNETSKRTVIGSVIDADTVSVQ